MNNYKPRPLLYLAGPYTAVDKRVQRHRAIDLNNTAGLLIHSGIHVYSPISMGTAIVKNTPELKHGWDVWHAIDFNFISRCDGLLVTMLAGWEHSKGVTAEIAFAHDMGIPVVYILGSLTDKASVALLRLGGDLIVEHIRQLAAETAKLN